VNAQVMGFYPQNVAGNKGTQLSAFILAVGFLRTGLDTWALEYLASLAL
jgi:hypothetical protein